MANWNKIKKDIKKFLNKHGHGSMLHHIHGVEIVPLCFDEEGYDNFINDLLEYIKKLIDNEILSDIMEKHKDAWKKLANK